MSWFNRISSNILSGARRLASAVVPRSIQRKFADLGNLIYNSVGPEQTSQEVVEHVRATFLFKMSNPFLSKKALDKHIVYCKEHGFV